MARQCNSCGHEILPGDKVRLKMGGIFGDTHSKVAFAIIEETKKYIQGTLVHKSCDTPIHGEEDDGNPDTI